MYMNSEDIFIPILALVTILIKDFLYQIHPLYMETSKSTLSR